MSTTGETFASSAISANLGFPDWVNTGNATGSNDGNDAGCTVTAFFGLPVDLEVQLNINGENIGNNLADTSTGWPVVTAVAQYGGDLRSAWGIGGELTPAIVNSTLQVKIRGRLGSSSDTDELRMYDFNWTDIPSNSIIDDITLKVWRHYRSGRGTRICLVDAVSLDVGYHAARNPWSQRWRL